MLYPPVENRSWPVRLLFAARPTVASVLLLAVLLLTVLVAGCGGSDSDSASDNPNIIDAGQIGQIQLPDDEPTAPPPPPAAADSPDEAAESAPDAEGADASADTDTETGDEAETGDGADADAIPLADDDGPAILGLIDAFDNFTSCFEREGFEFAGVPGQDGPIEDFPAGYASALGTCAASSNIVQAVQDSTAENAQMTPEEVEQRNEAYFVFESCLKDLGWNPAEPVPDQYGVLGPADGNFGAPDGVEDLLGPARKCASEAAAPLLDQAEDS